MAIIGDALRQAFMPKHEYESLRDEEKAWHKLQKPLLLLTLLLIALAVFVCTVISLQIVSPADNLRRPFCHDLRIQPLSINFTTPAETGGGRGESDLFPSAFIMTDQETVYYYWMVVFVPSAMIFAVSVVYLIAGIVVAYTGPVRHGCLEVEAPAGSEFPFDTGWGVHGSDLYRNSLETYVYNMRNQINDQDKLADKLESDEKEK